MESSIAFFVFACMVYMARAESYDDYIFKRKAFVSDEFSLFTGSAIKLTQNESKVNSYLMHLKAKEYNVSEDQFLPAIHFFKAKKDIENSQLFHWITKIPKGAALHVHDTSLVDVKWLVKEATYMYTEYLYMCTDDTGILHFRFSYTKPVQTIRGVVPQGCEWELLADFRRRYGQQVVDEWLVRNLSLIVDDPVHTYPTQEIVWQRFASLFTVADGLICFVEVFKRYFIEALHEFHADNVQYFEFRGLLPNAYDLSGNQYGEAWLMDTYINISTEFSKLYPSFIGTRFIYSSARIKQSISETMEKAIALRKKYPNYFLGFDLVGEEDPGQTLLYHMKTLLLPSQQGITMPFFFHAGETDWMGEGVDENLIDAILLNTTRIGHGYAITKHPRVLSTAREKGIAVEICPISNQVLKLVNDLRNHPVAGLIATDFPFVISSDDPGLWETRGLSYDWYEAFMGLAGAKADLRFLKQLAINSIRYSALSSSEKKDFAAVWQKKWDEFINDAIYTFNL